jgi:hypothetical protein
MKKILMPVLLLVFIACNNKKEENNTENKTSTTDAPADQPTDKPVHDLPTTSELPTSAIIDGKEIKLGGSLLVVKDKDKLQPGAPYLCMLTASGGPNQETLTLNFLLDTKPGTYPVVGLGMNRGGGDKGEVYGGLMGGRPKITNYKVTLTEVRDMGDNGNGGHKWSISGNFDDIVIRAMNAMLMDKSRNHPESVKVEKASFKNLTFDDNMEEIMNKAMDRMKNK